MLSSRLKTSFVVWATLTPDMLSKLIILLNTLAGVLADVLLAPVSWLPGWLSISLIAAVTGVLMLLVFKYTSNQEGIRRTRNRIRANLLALSLYKDSTAVSVRSQVRVLQSSGRLLVYALFPMLVMIVPTCLLLGQLAVWYQARPLKVGEDAVVTVQLADSSDDAVQQLTMVPSSAVQLDVGPVRVPSKQMVCWNVTAAEDGQHVLTFEASGSQFTKELVIGDGYQQTSIRRPAENWSDLLLYPWETPFSGESEVQSIEIDYPRRSALTSGTSTWLPYWFVASMVAAFAAKPFLGVNL